MSNMSPYPDGQYYQQPGGYVPGGFGPRPDEKNSLGIWSLGLGLVSFFCCGFITGIPAIIVGYLGIQAANEGRATNKGMSIAGIVLSLAVGLAAAVCMAYRLPVLDRLSRGYVELSRNTPLLIQLFFLYYGLPKIGIKIDGFTCGVIALVFLGGGYMAEALRAGLLAVPKGQTEAAKAIGLGNVQIFRYVVLPQAWAVSLPAIAANVLFLIKETSVIGAVSVAELMFVTKDIIGMDYKTNEALFLLFVNYLIILLPVSVWARYAERKVRRAKYGA